MGQSLPGDIVNTVSDSVNLGQSAGSATQNFGSAAQAGASIASSAQSGAVNPMDAVAVVQGISGGISDTADAVGSGASVTSTWLGETGQGAQLVADANPKLRAQAQEIQQLTQAGSQVADLTGQVAGGVSQVSGVVNSASSMGSSGPSVSDASGSNSDLLSEGGTATAVDYRRDTPHDDPKPDPKAPHPDYPGRTNDGKFGQGNNGDGKLEEKLALDKREARTGIPIIRQKVRAVVPGALNPDGSEQWRYYDGLESTGNPNEYLGIEGKRDGVKLTGPQSKFDRLVTPDNPARATLNGEPIRIVGNAVAYPQLPPGTGPLTEAPGGGMGEPGPVARSGGAAPAAAPPPAPEAIKPGEGGFRFGGLGGAFVGPPEQNSQPGHGLEIYPAEPWPYGGGKVGEADGKHHDE